MYSRHARWFPISWQTPVLFHEVDIYLGNILHFIALLLPCIRLTSAQASQTKFPAPVEINMDVSEMLRKNNDEMICSKCGRFLPFRYAVQLKDRYRTQTCCYHSMGRGYRCGSIRAPA